MVKVQLATTRNHVRMSRVTFCPVSGFQVLDYGYTFIFYNLPFGHWGCETRASHILYTYLQGGGKRRVPYNFLQFPRFLQPPHMIDE